MYQAELQKDVEEQATARKLIHFHDKFLQVAKLQYTFLKRLLLNLVNTHL